MQEGTRTYGWQSPTTAHAQPYSAPQVREAVEPPDGKKKRRLSKGTVIGIMAGAVVVLAALAAAFVVMSEDDTGSSPATDTTAPTTAAPAEEPTDTATVPEDTGEVEAVPESTEDIVIENVTVNADGTVTVEGYTTDVATEVGDITVTTTANGEVVNVPVEMESTGSGNEFTFDWNVLDTTGEGRGSIRSLAETQIQIGTSSAGSPATISFSPKRPEVQAPEVPEVPEVPADGGIDVPRR